MGKNIESDLKIKSKKQLVRSYKKRVQTTKRINSNLLRERTVEKFKNRRYQNIQKNKNKKINIIKNMKNLILQEHITCSICYQIITIPVRTQCGHIFCLHCLDKASLINTQCPLCRHIIQIDNPKCSTQITSLIDIYIQKYFSQIQRKQYNKRREQQLKIEAKRKIPLNLIVGDFVDYYNNDNKWISARIKQIYITFTILEIHKNNKVIQNIQVNLKSRRLARYRTFTVQPPLVPTYFTDDFNLNQPRLRYIVEPRNYMPRGLPRVQSNLVISAGQQRWGGSRWDTFQYGNERNNWLADDGNLTPLDNFWGSIYDENSLSLFS